MQVGYLSYATVQEFDEPASVSLEAVVAINDEGLHGDTASHESIDHVEARLDDVRARGQDD